jgi:hypothetical protein
MEPVIGSVAEYNARAVRDGWHSLCDPSLAFLHRDLAKLWQLWESEAGEDGVPHRRVMSPRLLKSFLRDIAIYERLTAEDGTRRYRVRLMGTAFAQILSDMTGKFLDETIPPEFLPRWHAALDVTLATGTALRFLGREDTNHMTFLTGEFFSAPLLADDGRKTLVLAAARYSGKRPWEDVDAEARQTLGIG